MSFEQQHYVNTFEIRYVTFANDEDEMPNFVEIDLFHEMDGEEHAFVHHYKFCCLKTEQ